MEALSGTMYDASARECLSNTMADIFISYSKADHALALKLSAFLEAEGWSVWWDKSLGAADLYRDEIMKQLAAARAVITIWTENSIKSDWVRAEAGAAKAQGKLIPVKTPEVAYGDIPLPFGEMHTENVGSTELIRAAVVAQLAKPAVEPSSWALLGKGLKWEVLTWWGIIGGAITLFVAISATLKLADWARVLVEHWKEWTHAFWLSVFGWLEIHVPPEWPPVLTFLSFGSLLTIGQAVKFNRIVKSQPLGQSFPLKSWRTLFCLMLFFVSLSPLTLGSLILLLRRRPQYDYLTDILSDILSDILYSMPDYSGYVIGEMLIIPPVIIVLFARHRLQAAISVVLMSVFYYIIVMIPLFSGRKTTNDIFAILSLVMVWTLPLILLLVAPPSLSSISAAAREKRSQCSPFQ